jgi:hypothetical protein
MTIAISIMAWAAIFGIGFAVGSGSESLFSSDVNAVILGAVSILFTINNSLNFNKIKKFEEMRDLSWLDVERRNKLRRHARRREKLFKRFRWPLGIFLALVTLASAGFLKIPGLDSEAIWWITSLAYSAAFALLYVTILVYAEFFRFSQNLEDLKREKEENERDQAFFQKITS